MYNKLVRDNIPDIIRSHNEEPIVTILNDADYISALNKKLTEEVNEYLKDEKIEELADIMEVVEAIANVKGCSTEKLMKIKEAKAKKNGKFEKRFFLKSVRSVSSK